MPGNVRIAGRQLEDRTFVPKEAVVERSRRQVVFVFEPGSPGAETGRAQWEYVTLGLENDTQVEIIPSPDGDDTFVPAGGEVVLVDGHATLTHDAQVRIENHSDLAAVKPRPTDTRGSGRFAVRRGRRRRPRRMPRLLATALLADGRTCAPHRRRSRRDGCSRIRSISRTGGPNRRERKPGADEFPRRRRIGAGADRLAAWGAFLPRRRR